MERRQHKHTRETSGVPPSSSTGSLSTEARQIHKAKNTEARHVPRWARRHCSPPASLIEEEGSHEDEHVPESPSPPLTHRPSYSTNRAPSAPPAPSSRMLRGVDPPPPSPPPPPPAAPSPPLSQHTCQTISDAFNNIVRGNKGYGGGVLRIESLTRGLLYEGAWGKTQHTSSRGKSTGIDMTPNVRFEVASITKTFTATLLLLLLLSRGTPPFLAGKLNSTSTSSSSSSKRIGTSLLFNSSSPASSASLISLGLDTTLANASASPSFLPSLLAPPHWHTATLRQLLSHTSGIADYWSDPSFLDAFIDSPRRPWTPTEILRDYARKQPPFPPSLPPSLPASSSPFPYHYSDTNYVLLGLLIEGWMEGNALHTVMKEMLWQPLGLRDTYFPYLQTGPPLPLPPSPPPSSSSVAAATPTFAAATEDEVLLSSQHPVLSHRYEGKEDLTGVPRQSADWAGGGMISSTKDLSEFVKHVLLEGGREGGRVLLEAMLKETHLTGDEDMRYGLGLFELDLVEGEDGVGGRVWGHDGWGHAFMYVYEPSVMKEGEGRGEEVLLLVGTVNQQDERADPWEAMMVALRAVVKDGK